MKLKRLLFVASIACCFVSSLSAVQPGVSDSLRTETEQLGQELESLAAECASLYARYNEAEGEIKILDWTILSCRCVEAEDKLKKFVDNVAAR